MQKEIKDILNKYLSTTDGWGNSPQDCEITGKEETIKQLIIFILRKTLYTLKYMDRMDDVYFTIIELEKELKNYE